MWGRAKPAFAVTFRTATEFIRPLDGGKTWKNAGLHDSRAIGKVIINPANPDIAFVAALGHPYGPNAERGIFRTTDGGKTWEKVLYKDENTGGIDVAFDPHNPNILFAALVAGAADFLEHGERRSRAADSTGRMTAARPGSTLKNTACPKDRMGGSAWPWRRILIACMR